MLQKLRQMRAFVHLDGVTDEWLNSLQVEKVPGGQASLREDVRSYAKFDPSDPFCSACLVPPPTQ